MGKSRLEAFSDGVIAIVTMLGIDLAFAHVGQAQAVYVAQAWLSLVPDRRIERLAAVRG